MECRKLCGACCIALSISSPLPGMPEGKPTGVTCIHLGLEMKCKIFNSPERPAVCAAFKPEENFCGAKREEAMQIFYNLENRE